MDVEHSVATEDSMVEARAENDNPEPVVVIPDVKPPVRAFLKDFAKKL